MNKRYEQSPGLNAVVLAAGSILGLIVAATLTFAFDNRPDGSTGTDVADSVSVYG
jgi:hypothetical protein